MSDTILGGDFTVYYLSDNNRKQIKWTGSATGTRTANQLYSALQDLFDELGQIDDGSPMSAQTPTEYTIGAIDASDIVPWFIDDETIQHITSGAIQTRLWTRITTLQPGIVRVRCSANTDLTYSNVGETVTLGGTASYGILLDVQGTGADTILWIRPTDSSYSATAAAAYASGADWSTASAAIETSGGGTATSFATADQVVQTGESLFANIYSLGSLTQDVGSNPTSDLYAYQNNTKIVGWTSGLPSTYQWWPTGQFDILMKVKSAGANIYAGDAAITGTTTVTLTAGDTTKLRVGQPVFGQNIMTGTVINTIASITGLRTFTLTNPGTNGTGLSIYTNTIDGSYVTVLNREFNNTYDYFIVDLNAGGRNPIPLATGDDLNNTTGTYVYTASAGTGTFTKGEIIYVGASLAAASAKGVVTSVTGTGNTSVVIFFLIGNLTTIVTDDDITGAVSGATITTGTVAANTTPYDPSVANGITIASAIGGYNDDINNGNGTNWYSIQIDPATNALSRVYEYTKYLTRRGAGVGPGDSTDGLTGESYIGLDYRITYTTDTPGQMAAGSIAFQAASGAYGTVVTHDTTQRHIILRNSRGSFVNSQPITNGTETVSTAVVVSARTPIKPNPFGTFAGGKFFAAYAVMFVRANLAPADVQAYQLVSIDGQVQVPPNTVNIIVTGLLTGDHTAVFRRTGNLIDKATYTTNATAVNAGSVVVSTAIASSDPKVGYLRLVIAQGAGIFKEHRYRYDNWATSTFTLTTVTTGQGGALTATAATVVSGNLILVTLGTAIATSGAGSVQVGDMVYVHANGTPGTVLDYGHIVKIVDTTHLQVRVNSGSITNWSGTGNEVRYNVIVQAAAGTDKAYVPIIDSYVDGVIWTTSVSNSLIYPGSDINVLARVRAFGDIIPFEQLTAVSSTGITISTVRTADTIAT